MFLANAKRMVELSRLDQVTLCCRQLSTTDKRSTLKLQDACLAGDIIEVFSLPKVEAVLQVTKHCYQDIPVKVID